MKLTALVLCLAASAAASAQTAPKPAAPAKPATATKSTATKSTAAKAPAAKAPAATAPGVAVVKYPPGKKAETQIKKTLFALKVQDIKVGTGADAEPLKMYKVKYTGWRAADGVVFDAWDQHPTPVMGEDGKPVMGEDGKPKTSDPQPASFPVGMGRMIPGFDQGFSGMKVGGIRRVFIPWQLAYGSRTIPDRDAAHPGIPAKSDLVFEVELIDISEMPAPASHPGMPGMPSGSPHPPSTPPPTPPSGAPPSQPQGQPSTPPPSQPQAPPPSTPPPSTPQPK